MPTVRRQTERVEPQGIPGVRVRPVAPAEAFGGGQARTELPAGGERQALGIAAGIAAEEKRKADDAATQDAYARDTAGYNDLLHNPETGALQRRGRNALGVTKEYLQRYDEQAQQIEDGLYNEDQKRVYREIRGRRRAEMLGVLERHTGDQIQRVDDVTAKAALDNAQQDAALNWAVPGKVEESLRLQEALLTRHADDHGLRGPGDEFLKNAITATRSRTDAAVVSRMLEDGDDRAAQKYFAATESRMLEDDRRHARTAFRAFEIDRDRIAALQKRRLEEAREKTRGDFLTRLTENRLSAQDVLNSNLEAFGDGSKDTFLRRLKEAQSRRDSGVVNDLIRRIHLPDGDPQKVTSEAQLVDYVGRGVDSGALKFLRQEIRRPLQAGEKGLYDVAESQLVKKNPLMGIEDPDGETALLQFKQHVREEIEKRQKENKPVGPLLDPTSKEWLGHSLSSFQKSPQQIIQSMTRFQGSGTPRPEQPPRQPGESTAAYIQRLRSTPQEKKP